MECSERFVQSATDGDIVSVDVGVFKDGFHGDSAYTFAVGNINDDEKKNY